MEITNRELLNSVEAIQVIRATKPAIKPAHSLALAFHKLEPFIRVYNEIVTEARQAYPVLDAMPDASETAFARAAHQAEQRAASIKLSKEMEPLLDKTISFEQAPISLATLVDKKGEALDLDVGTIQALCWLFVE